MMLSSQALHWLSTLLVRCSTSQNSLEAWSMFLLQVLPQDVSPISSGACSFMSTDIGMLVQLMEDMRTAMVRSMAMVTFMPTIHTPLRWSGALTKMASTLICISTPFGQVVDASALANVGVQQRCY
mmetsp:Transcript_59826/g.110769  ORF Transcript_59826/g.110769 Transcript_59826/m.110769 type:complete len:126 (-) Transcript_59826:59-436(-)